MVLLDLLACLDQRSGFDPVLRFNGDLVVPQKKTQICISPARSHTCLCFCFVLVLQHTQSQTRSCREDQSLISSRCPGAVLQCPRRCCVTSLSVSMALTGGTPNLNYDLSGSDLRRLYNSPVFKAERMKRPLTGTSFVLGPLSHSGVRSVHVVTVDPYILTGRSHMSPGRPVRITPQGKGK